MACLASGRSTLRMSGTCTTRGMTTILPDLTLRVAELTAYSLLVPDGSARTGTVGLRRKLGDPPVITTTPGVGYRIPS
jgi:hypothetical protein